MSELRIGLSGAGMITEFHLRAWSRVPEARVVCIADPDIGRAASRAAEFGIAHHYPDLNAMLAAERIDALDIASPREIHAGQVLAAAIHGIPVLCQKPLAPTLGEAEQLVRDLGNRVRLMVHENWRFRPYYRQVAEWVRAGKLGSITGATLLVHNSGLVADAAGDYPALTRQPFFRTENRLFIAETLIHHLDVLRWLLGPLQMVAAHASHATDAVVGETGACLLMRNDDGISVLLDGNMACAGLPARTSDRLGITGTRASILLEHDRLQLLGATPESISYAHDEAYQGCFDAAIGHFVDCLRSGAAFETSPADNLATLQLVEDAYRLAR